LCKNVTRAFANYAAPAFTAAAPVTAGSNRIFQALPIAIRPAILNVRCSAADKSERRPSLIRKKGLWVYTGEIPPGYDILQAINEKREERMRLSEQEKDKTPAKADAAG
jgi:hypothetical protein